MSNMVGLQECYWWGTSIRNNLDSIIEYTAKSGADYIELNPSTFLNMSKKEQKELKNKINDKGLGITVNGSLMTADKNLISEDRLVVESGKNHCKTVLEACGNLNSPIWTGLIHGVWLSNPKGRNIKEEKKEIIERAVKNIKSILHYAEEYNVICCLEIVNRYELFYLNTGKEGVDFCKEVSSPYCKVLLDTYHMNIEEDNSAQTIQYVQGEGELANIHIGESNRKIPIGEHGNIDWESFGSAVKESGYTGPISLEPYPFSTAKNAVSVSVWRDLYDPDDLEKALEYSQKGIAYMKKIIK